MTPKKILWGPLKPSSKIFWLKHCSRDSNLFVSSSLEHSLSVKFCIAVSLPKSTALFHRYSVSIKSGFDSWPTFRLGTDLKCHHVGFQLGFLHTVLKFSTIMLMVNSQRNLLSCSKGVTLVHKYKSFFFP